MYRKSLVLALALALSSIAPALAGSDDDLEKWDDRTTVEDDNTHTLDSVDEGRTDSLDAADTGQTESLDSADQRRNDSASAPGPAAPLPAVENGNWEAQAAQAKQRIAAAEERLRKANIAYSEMRARNYPRGEAAEKIVSEREAAEGALSDAWDTFERIERAAHDAGRPL
jgi:hypothetical protein